MATHSSILAWRIPWTEEPSGLQSMESQLSDLALRHTGIKKFTERESRDSHHPFKELSVRQEEMVWRSRGLPNVQTLGKQER